MFDWFWNFLYGIQKSICYIIDFIVNTFRVLAGLNPVLIDGDETDILTYFLTSQTIRQAFFLVVMIAIVLLFVFCIVQTIRKQYSKTEQRSYGAIIGQALKAGLMFLLVPLIFVIANALLTVVVQQLDLATNPYYEDIINNNSTGYTGMSFGGQLLVTLGHDSYIGDAAARSSIEAGFINGSLNYTEIDVVRSYYNLNTMDYFLGYVSGIAVLILFAISMIQFVERVFNILLLFIVSPISVSSSVLDDGVRFKLWRDQVIGKFLSAYSIIISINLFFIIIPLVNQIDFNVVFFGGTSFSNYLIKMFFILGGAYAVHKSVAVIGNLIQQGLGSQELSDRKNAMLIAGGAFHAVTGTARSVGRGAMNLGGSAIKHTAGRGVVDRKQQHDFSRMMRNQNKASERVNRNSASEGVGNNQSARYDGAQADSLRASILDDHSISSTPDSGGSGSGGGGTGNGFSPSGNTTPATTDDAMRNRVRNVVTGGMNGKSNKKSDGKGGK